MLEAAAHQKWPLAPTWAVEAGIVGKTLILLALVAFLASVVGWAMPNPATDSANDAVPLIPTWGHNTIVAGMNAKIFKFAYGSKNEKTLDAIAEYEQGLQDLMSKKQFDPNYRSQLTISEDAVRST